MAIDQETSIPSDRVTRRSYDAIYKNVCTVAEIGVGNGRLRTAPWPDLLWAARVIRYGSEDASGQQADEIGDLDMIEYALRHAISGLDGSGPKSMSALFGLTDDTSGLNHTDRREWAVQDGELAVTAGSFRTHREKSLLSEVARILCHLADERIMNDWEARLKQREVELEAKVAGNGSMRDQHTTLNDDFAEFQRRFDSTLKEEPPKVQVDVVQATPTTVVRQSEPEEPETIGEGLHMIAGVISTIYKLIMGQFDPGQYRKYVAQKPRLRRGKHHSSPPRPIPTTLEYAVAISLLLVTLFFTCAVVIGVFVTIRFCARLISG